MPTGCRRAGTEALPLAGASVDPLAPGRTPCVVAGASTIVGPLVQRPEESAADAAGALSAS